MRRLPILHDNFGDALADAAVYGHEIIDAGAEYHRKQVAVDGHRLPCKRGCDACCFYPMSIMVADLWVIVRHLGDWRPEDRAVVRRRLDIALSQVRKRKIDLRYVANRESARIAYIAERVACPFLSDRECSIYDARPAPCRYYLVVGDPAICADPHARPVIVSMEDVIAQSAQGAITRFRQTVGRPVPLAAVAGLNSLVALDQAWRFVEEPGRSLQELLDQPALKEAAHRTARHLKLMETPGGREALDRSFGSATPVRLPRSGGE